MLKLWPVLRSQLLHPDISLLYTHAHNRFIVEYGFLQNRNNMFFCIMPWRKKYYPKKRLCHRMNWKKCSPNFKQLKEVWLRTKWSSNMRSVLNKSRHYHILNTYSPENGMFYCNIVGLCMCSVIFVITFVWLKIRFALALRIFDLHSQTVYHSIWDMLNLLKKTQRQYKRE